MLLVELHHLFVHALLVVLVLLLQRLELRRIHLQPLHRADLLDRERQDHDAHESDEHDDRPGPGEPDRRMQPFEDVREEVLDRREDVGERDHAVRRARLGGKRRWSRTWSTPPWLHGLQRSEPPGSQQAAAQETELPKRVDRVLRAGRVVLAATLREGAERVPIHVDAGDAGGPGEAGEPPHAVRASSPAPSRPGNLPHLVDQPLEALGSRRPRRGPAARRGRSRARRGSSELTRSKASRRRRFTRLRSTAPPTLRETARPRRGSRADLVLVAARKRVQDEVAGRHRPAVAVHGVEVPRAGEPAASTHAALRRTAACGLSPGGA